MADQASYGESVATRDNRKLQQPRHPPESRNPDPHSGVADSPHLTQVRGMPLQVVFAQRVAT